MSASADGQSSRTSRPIDPNFFQGADDYGRVRISGQTLSASIDLLPDGATAPFRAWETYSTPFTATAFEVSQAEWESILADVTEVRFTIESLFGPEVNGFDNFRIAPPPSVPSISTLGAILLSGAVMATGLMAIRRPTRQRSRGTGRSR